MAVTSVKSSDLIKEVGALIDLNISDNTTPSSDDVLMWMNRAAIKLFKILPPEHLIEVTNEDLFISSSVVGSDFSKPVLRIVDVLGNGVSCEKITKKEIKSIGVNAPYRYSTNQPAYAVSGYGGSLTLEVYPFAVTVTQVSYIPAPTKYDKVSEGDEFSPPEALEEFIVQYASIMSREQDEEPGQFQLYMKQWMEDVQMAYSIPAQNGEG